VSDPLALEPDLAPRLSVVVPAYREAGRIGATVAALRASLAGLGAVEVVVVDDGSHDDTAQAARAAGADLVIRLPVNRGKGAAVRAGMLGARGEVVVFTDADLSYPPAQLARLVDALEEGADVVVGSRHHAETTTLVSSGLVRQLSGRVFNVFTRPLLGGQFRDTQCGLKGFRREAAVALFSRSVVDGFAFDVEILWLSAHLGLTVRELPVELANAEGSTVRLRVEVLRMVRDLWGIRRRGRRGGYGPALPARGGPGAWSTPD